MARDAKLVALAQERGLIVTPEMVNKDLYRLLDPTAPTPDQLTYLSDLIGREVPVKSFAHARKLLDELEDLRNVEVLERYDWNIGDVLMWGGAYWRIKNIFTGHRLNHKCQLESVDLVPNGMGGARCVLQPSRTRIHNPRVLEIEHARKVDRSVWPVQLVEYPPDPQ